MSSTLPNEPIEFIPNNKNDPKTLLRLEVKSSNGSGGPVHARVVTGQQRRGFFYRHNL